MEPDFKVCEVAEILRVSNATILTWIRGGTIRATNVARSASARPIYRISHASLEEFRMNRSKSQNTIVQVRKRRRLPEVSKKYF